MARFEFPKNFYWGAATSAHQVEGGNHNDWSEWEKENAKRMAENVKHEDFQYFLLDTFPSPLDTQNYISGQACDHYNRFREDFDIAKQLGHTAHRFSIEWSRIEPEEGTWNEKEIIHYQEVINALRERGIEPFVTLWHWTLPLWVAKQGGWENKKTINDFARYTQKVTASLQGVKFWITLNEPEIYTSHSYFSGTWLPQKKSFFVFNKVFKNLISAHKKVYAQLKKIQPSIRIGIAKNNIYFDGWATPVVRWWWNKVFLNHIHKYQDFIGLNYYFHNRIKGFKFNQNENKETTDINWEIYPQGILQVLKELKIYKRPIYITENGIANAKDDKRAKFIKEHIKWIVHAINEGVDVRGYLYWSLLDNFEWDKGFWPRFGLVEMNYKTMERKIRPSAYEYKKIIDSNSIEL